VYDYITLKEIHKIWSDA